MHGLIFETSIWLLAGSTRLCNLSHCDHNICLSSDGKCESPPHVEPLHCKQREFRMHFLWVILSRLKTMEFWWSALRSTAQHNCLLFIIYAILPQLVSIRTDEPNDPPEESNQSQASAAACMNTLLQTAVHTKSFVSWTIKLLRNF